MNRVKKDHTVQKPFIDHLHELQIRLTWSVLAIVALGIGAYTMNEQLLSIIQEPLGQTLYYTSPTGGFSFIFKLCAVAGIVAALPVLLYHLFKFMGPLLERRHGLTILAFVMWGVNMAFAGILFAYFFSLPAALHFLAKFGGENIQSLITADEYFNFALAYLAGFAVLFQLPLVILFINRIKPLKPGRMMSAQRYIILISFVIAAILTPTPDPINQAIMAVPVILLYQVSIALVIAINYSSRPKRRHAKAAKAAAKAKAPAATVVPVHIEPEVQEPVQSAPSRPVIPVQPVTRAQNYGYAGFSTPQRPVISDIIMR
jgi:sec-independent protein translocase protein TatC